MAITDELRGWINDNYPAWKKLRTGVSDQLDRIDAKHERELTMARGEAANKTLEVMGDGYIALPKDANGEVIHIGDELDDGLDQSFTPKKVKMLMLEGDEWMLNFGCGWCVMKHHEWRHHTPDTWERIIKDAMEGADRDGSPDTYQECVAELVARCKALAGSDAE